jgi:hypothetical protein
MADLTGQLIGNNQLIGKIDQADFTDVIIGTKDAIKGAFAPIPTSPDPPRKPWYRIKAFRYTVNFIVTIVCTECLAGVAYYSPQHTSILAILLFAFIPAVIIWWGVNLVQSYDESAATYKQEIDNQIKRNNALNSEIEELTIQLKDLIENAAKTLDLYPPFRSLLNRETRQKKLIRHFLRKSMSPALSIWDISDGDFYELVQEGIRDCYKWGGIHYGKISKLQTNFPYLKDLSNVTSQRIVVLSKEDAKELEDRTIVDEFLVATRNTPSYWIDEDKFFEIARLSFMKERLKLDDCALHDGEVLLLRDRVRKIAMLSIRGANEPIFEGIVRAFEELNLQLKGFSNPDAKFTKIE